MPAKTKVEIKKEPKQPKRVGFLFEKAFMKSTIREAIYNAAKCKKNRKDVQAVLCNIDTKVDEIYELMWFGDFDPAPYTHMQKYDAGKMRDISKPNFYPDQIIHWCIYLVLKPVLIPIFSKHVYSCIPGRGQVYGRRMVEEQLKHKGDTKWCLKLDIKKFYPSVNNDKLMILLGKKIKDPKLLALIQKILNLQSGLPIGILLSQILGNFYLNEALDKKHDSFYYNRFADDIVIFGSNKRDLQKLRQQIVIELAEFDLQMNNRWQIFRIDKRMLDFMGFKFNHKKTILRKKNIRNTRRAVKEWIATKSYHAAASLTSHMGWVKHSDSYKFYRTEIKPNVNWREVKAVQRKESKKQCEHTNRNQTLSLMN